MRSTGQSPEESNSGPGLTSHEDGAIKRPLGRIPVLLRHGKSSSLTAAWKEA
jgi:hypothetical protein